jgi:hypothetical protein
LGRVCALANRCEAGRSGPLNRAVIAPLTDNCLSNGIFSSCDVILGHCCEAWNKLADQPRQIMTIGKRKWAN